ncbi:hypothetical protein IMG5_047060 [Ichthyophthirius multifiliis]|uniref:Uncharacterized protein n=1 Tax=Ichthyophthirius multifiliis TaxID=5932 RepID=G0QMA3_ICHMU|nr:hypothetical protein IMG5_047060 [Ichthyophthirius multifiliis]EGR33660.1 hypothetical protein IMG5_047060 [Ichthyophthirius multifiliis]|eukprot:XP_004037646.1 hypothetical protein IMG5_047060 [Ichthyophthirius multifiliis]
MKSHLKRFRFLNYIKKIKTKKILQLKDKLQDENSHKPDLNIPAFDYKRTLIQTNFDQTVLVENPKFQEPQTKIQDTLQKKVEIPKGLMLLDIELVDFGLKTMITMNEKLTVADVVQYSVGFLDRIFSDPQTCTKNPFRLIQNLQSIIEFDNKVIMKVIDSQNKIKELKYVIDNQNDKIRLINKIEGLLQRQQKKQQVFQSYQTTLNRQNN